jgi:hypothetical protein
MTILRTLCTSVPYICTLSADVGFHDTSNI